MKAKEFVARRQSVDEFYLANKKDLERMAGYILKRWPAPNDVSVEDVVQDLLLECWRKRLKFDPSRGPTAEQFLSFNAISYAKRNVHRARRGRGDRGIGTFDLLTSSGDVTEMGEQAIDAVAESELERQDRLRELLATCGSTREAICLFVFVEEQDAQAAGDRIYKDVRLREACQAKSAADARAAVKQTIKEHAAIWQG